MNGRRTAGYGAAAAVLGAAGLTLAARADDRAVRADPRAAELADDLPSPRVQQVRSADGTALHVEVHGPEDAPTVVLSHGWTCAIRFWTPQLRRLATTHRVVAYDQRGHGRSGTPHAGGFGAQALADDLSAVLRATVHQEHPAVVVGHSMGAMSIVAWAGEHPDEVRQYAAAVLLASTGVDDLVSDSLLVRLPTGWRRTRALVGRLVLTAPGPMGPRSPLTRRGVRYVALSAGASPAQVEFCERIILGCAPRARTGWGRALTSLDLRQAVARLDVPAIVLVGGADRLTPPVHARRLAADLPRLERLIELPGVGHMSPVEQPEAVYDEIRRLVDTFTTNGAAA
jgi:pimeloyl-ACP methyl ester carboxylesterase